MPITCTKCGGEKAYDGELFYPENPCFCGHSASSTTISLEAMSRSLGEIQSQRETISALKARCHHLEQRLDMEGVKGQIMDMEKDWETENEALKARCDRLKAALKLISLASGAFSTDQLIHAKNVIENSTRIACEALEEEDKV